MVHIPDATRKKLDPKGREGIFVGYFDTSKAFRVWIPEKQKVVISRDVLVDESSTLTDPSNKTGHILVYPDLSKSLMTA